MRLNVPASVMEIKEHPLPKMHSTEIVRFSKPPSPVLNVMAEEVVEKEDGIVKLVLVEELSGVIATEWEPSGMERLIE